MIKSLAELKRDAKNYTWELYFNSFMNKQDGYKLPDRIKGERVVVTLQTNSLSFRMPDGKESWLDWPKASCVRFEKYIHNNEHTIVYITVEEDEGIVLGKMYYHLRPIKKDIC